MPTLGKVLQPDDLRTQRTPAGLDLARYLEIIDTIREQGGVGGDLTLADDEAQRAEKGRLTRAAKQRNLKLTWRKAAAGTLRFVLSEPGESLPDARRRRGSD